MAGTDLNADIGEISQAIDSSLLRFLSSASIACGGHTGNDLTMRRAVRAAIDRGIRIGAHPSYPDPGNFGRVSMMLSGPQLVEALKYQIGRLVEVADSEGAYVAYIKPHGALYNDAAVSEEKADAVFEAARHYSLRVMMLAGSRMAATFPKLVITEGFIDRGYRQDGTLVPRSDTHSLIMDADVAAEQALRLAPSVDSLCVHSDTPNAVELLTAARRALVLEGYEIKAQ